METNNKDLFIGPDITAEALINIQFRQECPKGNATKATSLILQTFSFFLALKRSGTKELVVGSSSEGRKVLIAAYGDLAAANPLHPEAKGYVSSFRHPDELAFTLNLSKTSQSALSSNFLTNIERNPENYGDFKYDKSTSTLRILPDLSNFKDALNKLQKTVLKDLVIFVLRSIPLRTTVINGERFVQINQGDLVELFGIAGELLWDLSDITTSISIGALAETPANITTQQHPQIFGKSFGTQLVSALAAKPFVILAGGTGTGKTRAARLVAIQIAGKENVSTVAVGADWTDNRPLLGFRNLLSPDGASYVAPEALKLILKADKNLRDAAMGTKGENGAGSPIEESIMPFFLILDEMNLSHVERYFADFLSSMESGEALKLHDYEGELKADGSELIIPREVDWPRNLFVIGTVNIDETTYMFSPKVLDRAHVIEFKVEWDQIKEGLSAPPASELPRWSSEQTRNFTRIALDDKKVLGLDDQAVLEDILAGIHECMKDSRYNFAHRTARECLNYVAAAQRLDEAGLAEGHEINGLIDLAILQKVLPKLNGSTGSLTEILNKLSEFTSNHVLKESAEKLRFMANQLKNDQFVSFIQ